MQPGGAQFPEGQTGADIGAGRSSDRPASFWAAVGLGIGAGCPRVLSPILVWVLASSAPDAKSSPPAEARRRSLYHGMERGRERGGLEGRNAFRAIHESVATFEAFRAAMERILGIAPGTLHLIDPDTLRWWFEQSRKEHP